MGVRGLTTYIASNAERFLKPFELHGCDLVIDGDNLCIQLFARSEVRMGAYGGNYDHYFRAVVEFFVLLQKCKVRSFVLLDGGYEKRKLKKVRSRLLSRIHFVKKAKAGCRQLIIPLLIREVFVDALRAARVRFMRCLFEADNEIAILARKLDCPVLSYDSDFYIYNVKYIPYVTLTHKLYRKVIETDDNYEIQLVDNRRKRNRVLAKQGEGVINKGQSKISYCFLDCCLYTIENLIGSEGRLKREMLPLFATLLGNDYIERRVLSSFYASMKVGKVSRKVAPHQRRIVGILKWLQHHSIKSAMKTILNQVREGQRKNLMKQLQGAMYGYNCEDCISYEHFGFGKQQEVQDAEKKFKNFLEEADDVIPIEEDVSLGDDTEDLNNDGKSDHSDEEESESTEGEQSEDQENDIEDVCDETRVGKALNWEPWLLEIYQAARTPRFVVDLYYSNLYINYPQSEDITKPDSNEICYSILLHIFALLKSSKKGGNFKYLTRCEKVAQCRWIKFQDVALPEGIEFNPSKEKNVALFKIVFDDFSNTADIFAVVEKCPANFQLYILSLIFWIRKSQNVTCVHIHSLLICMIQLQIIDKQLATQSRHIDGFRKKHKSYLESMKQRFKRVNITLDEQKPLKKLVNKLSYLFSKPQVMLTYDVLIPHFSIKDREQRKQAVFDHSTTHIFAEFQAVVLNLFTLNALLGHPFEAICMHGLYNGLFIHNVYQTLKSRPDPLEYVKSTVFRYSGAMFELHRVFYCAILKLAPDLETRNRVVKTKSRTEKTDTGDRSKQNEALLDNDCVLVAEDEDESSSSKRDSFDDLNNQFSQLHTLS
ncbi:protein asteroid [Toxorhynchites rutilus septentrionalis]|uniref:protein asteroid n=1 Tax=Toxorhynchites rutilus septentrionalis TaxID=329112 RepID=UPI0024799AB8|nr:protein asteroid [Toxorhynchites rutilus septentrionalis]